ncbi:DNA polymerase III subunit gamma/tau [Aliidiomarina minuta]|uniref:DNA polymerase III subunit gamma/tau n=1 Tax=Aliidiomarina minuta TaxID=880057 RepID=A0A432W7W7_9GAMM|nr:DNA polymerase III subunit gamma/tau [Aliidiomarina minuta]RUO26197.1 DNA polymerase III subunit gamma/tau [Aliidiomarina minuta]
MSYQVLARKWRPQTFSAVVGQQHVLQALSNALTSQRLHHAYLLTGTRGVGKTTIARILAKSLNCEEGISATPCGKCSTCLEIDEGRYIDLLEIDAASRTKVEDTRELLDNVQYRPSRGRYKVYLIDEVHMLSRHSFNALLKTLEEPPEHVKFLLATTDPEKLPVTVLSRCLQFHLRALTRDEISAQLAYVLKAESVPFDESGLSLLARAAKGSMRDALSLTDQAIAQGDQAVVLESVQRMLGHIEGRRVLQLLAELHAGESENALQSLRSMQSKVPDVAVVLPELQNLLHQLALYQVSPQVAETDLFADQEQLQSLAQAIAPEVVQVYYRIVLEGRRELPHAVDAFSAVEMTLLRLLAFRPVDSDEFQASEYSAHVHDTEVKNKEQVESVKQAPAAKPAEPELDEQALYAEQDEILQQARGQQRPEPAPMAEVPPQAQSQPEPVQPESVQREPQAESQPQPANIETTTKKAQQSDGMADLMATREQLLAKKKAPERVGEARYAAEIDAWSASVDGLQAGGRVRQVLLNSVLQQQESGYQLLVAEAQKVLCSPALLQEVEQLVRELVGGSELTIEFGEPVQTPFILQQSLDKQRQQRALQSVQEDARIQGLVTRFDAELQLDSVKPKD